MLNKKYGTHEKFKKNCANFLCKKTDANHTTLNCFYNKEAIYAEYDKKLDDISKKAHKEIDKKLDKMGDRYSNYDQKSSQKDKITIFLIPVGYIKYKYDKNEYFYIKNLMGEEDSILKATAPQSDLPKDLGGKVSALLCFYGFYWLIFFLVAKFIKNLYNLDKNWKF